MAEQMNLDPDFLARDRMVAETDINFFVEAGAGAGKTTMLVNRMVAMIEQGKTVDKICAITFTKAAAGEFYERFQKMLIERSNPDYVYVDKGYAGQLPPPTEETRERCAKALRDIDLCFMGTIDSFCNVVLSEHPFEAGIPSDASIMSSREARTLYRQQYVRICEGMIGDADLKALSTAFRALHRNPEEVFVKGMELFMDHRNVSFAYVKTGAVDVDKAFASDRASLLKVLDHLRKHPELSYDGNKDSRAAWEALEDDYKVLRRRWGVDFSRVRNSLKRVKDLRLIGEADTMFSGVFDEWFEIGGAKGKWMECTLGSADGLFDRIDRLRYDISMSFLAECVPVIEEAMREKGRLSFFDYLFYLRNMLAKDAEGTGDLIRYIYDRHQYFLIDEFQDTNPMQAEVFFYLTAKEPKANWRECVPRPGALFIVGDPKQSIYRFRSADVTSYLKVKELFCGDAGEVLHLSRNFRSTLPMCSYFNRVFETMLPEETEYQCKYEPIPLTGSETDEFGGIFSYTAYTGKAAGDHPDQTDPVQVGKIIRALVGNPAYRIKRGDEKEPRKIRYSDIMVITYGKSKLAPIMEELDRWDIPAKVEGKVPFETTAALYEIERIYRAVANPKDKLAQFRVLTGSLAGRSERDVLSEHIKKRLQWLAESSGKEETACMSSSDAGNGDGRPASDIETGADTPAFEEADIRSRLERLGTDAHRLSPAALFSRIMDDFEICRYTGANNLEVLYYTLELMRSAERSGEIVSLEDGAAYLRLLLSGESEEERCLSLTEQTDRVHMANLHKVKGLEAPIVILAAAGDKASTPTSRIVQDVSGAKGYVFSLDGDRGEYGQAMPMFETTRYDDEKTVEKQMLDAEKTRLIYVAATRARNALFLCNCYTGARNGYRRNTMWEPLFEDGTKDFFEWIGEEVEQNEASGEVDSSANDVSARTADASATGMELSAPVKGPVASAKELYRKAKEGCALNDRGNESASYWMANPSHAVIASKLSEDREDVMVSDPAVMSSELQETSGAQKAFEVQETSDAQDAPKAQKESEVQEPEWDVHRFPTLLGTLTHRLMELMVMTRAAVDAKELVDRIWREYRTPRNAPYEIKMKEALCKVAKTMLAGGYEQTNEAPRDVLKTLLEAEECYCEVPFCYRDEDAGNGEKSVVLWNGIIDVLYKKDGKWHILDYKTNAEGEHLDVKYASQLEAYQKAFYGMTGEKAEDAMTYHIDI